MLARMQQRGQNPIVELYMEAQTLPDAPSRNLIIEIQGSVYPDQYVVVGGHSDSVSLLVFLVVLHVDIQEGHSHSLLLVYPLLSSIQPLMPHLSLPLSLALSISAPNAPPLSLSLTHTLALSLSGVCSGTLPMGPWMMAGASFAAGRPRAS